MKFSLRLVVSGLVLGLFPSSLEAMVDKQPLAASETSLQICIDQQTEESLTGDIELMLVMDNSLSLRINDPEGKRFLQVRAMLKSVHDGISDSRDVRFSFITFANRATVEIPLRSAQVLRNDNLDKIASRVESAAPGNQKNTDYVAALDKALEEMASASPENCRVIVWFTDGAYWPSVGATGDSPSGGVLRDKVCSTGGFSDRLRTLNVNLFPLYIEPKSSDAKEDATASRDVMVHLTGDQDAFDKNPYQAGSPCDKQTSHIGEVLAAENVNQLGQFFVDLGNIIAGFLPVACPTKDGKVDSKPMPAGRYVEKISIVRYALSGQELRPKDLSVLMPDNKTNSLDKYFEGKDGRYEATEAAKELKIGWRIQGSGEEHCIRALPREDLAVQIRKDSEGTNLVPIGDFKSWLDGEDLLSPAEDKSPPIVRLGPKANCKERDGFATDAAGLNDAFQQLEAQAEGVICVDPQDIEVFPLGVTLNVSRFGRPLITCKSIQIRRSGADEFISFDRTERSSECEVDFRESGTKFTGLDSNFGGLLSADEAESCNLDTASSTLYAKTRGEIVIISVTAALKENRETKCRISGKQISFSYTDVNGKVESEKVPFEIELNLQPEPNRLAALIATAITVIILLGLALALLRRLTIEAAALLAANKLFAVRFGAQVSRSGDGRSSISIENRPLRELQIDQGRVERAQLKGSDTKLDLIDEGDTLAIRREMPPLRWMLREPWAWIDDTRRYVVHPQGRRAPANQNLIAPFREAIIALDEGEVKGSDNLRGVSIWVIKQKGSPEGDQNSIAESLKENGLAVVDELLQSLADTESGYDGPPSPPGGPGVPPPPAPPSPPSGPSVPLPPDW